MTQSDCIIFSAHNLDYDSTVKLRFFFIFFIILYHCAPVELVPQYIGVYLFLFVAPFFFLSGYGLSYSIAHKPNYLSTLIVKRNRSLVVPMGIGIVCLNVLSLGLFCDPDLLFLFPTATFPFHWFLLQLLFLYFVFYAAFAYSSNLKQALLVLFPLIIISMITLSVLTAPFYTLNLIFYAQGTLGFYIGILWYYAQEKEYSMNRILFYILLAIATATLLLFDPFEVSYHGPSWDSGIPQGLFQMCVRGIQYIAFLFIMFVIQTEMLTKKNSVLLAILLASVVLAAVLRGTDADLSFLAPSTSIVLMMIAILLSRLPQLNPALLFLGAFSYELFIMHQPVFGLFNPFYDTLEFTDPVLRFMTNLVLTFIISYFVFRVSKIAFAKLDEKQRNGMMNVPHN